jgi:TonB family protein
MNEPAIESGGPDRPPPVLPEVAFFLSDYAALELTITADRDGCVQKVVISKPSRAKLYDEYTRNWVEKHWKMPAAKPGEPELRKFVAPIVYPKPRKPPGAYCPPPSYPTAYERDRVEGLVIVEFRVGPSGKVETARTTLSSGHKGLDAYTVDWVLRKWKFAPGEVRSYYWPVAYLMR